MVSGNSPIVSKNKKYNYRGILFLIIILAITPIIILAFSKSRFDIRNRAQTPITVPPGDPKVTCTVAAFYDDPRNNPPVYYEQTLLTTVQPGQKIVWGIGFSNPSNYDFSYVKNFIHLGSFQNFLDASSYECPLDPASKSLVCSHGLFLHGGASSMAIRTQFTGTTPVPIDTLAVSFTNIGTTGACSYLLSPYPTPTIIVGG